MMIDDYDMGFDTVVRIPREKSETIIMIPKVKCEKLVADALKSCSTDQLVTKLESREGVKSYTCGSDDVVDIRITYDNGVGGTGNEETKGPAKILVVVD